MQFPGWAQRAHPDYVSMAAAPDSRYSCLMPWGLRATTRAYRLELGNNIARFTTEAVTIVDAMANVGCDSAHFLRMFPAAKLIAIEANPATAEILAANLALIKRAGATPARVICADSAEFLGLRTNIPGMVQTDIPGIVESQDTEHIRADIVYFDPPWCASLASAKAEAAESAEATVHSEWRMPERLAQLCVGSLPLAAAAAAALRIAPLVVVKLPPDNLAQFNADMSARGAAVTAHEIQKPGGEQAYFLAFVRCA